MYFHKIELQKKTCQQKNDFFLWNSKSLNFSFFLQVRECSKKISIDTFQVKYNEKFLKCLTFGSFSEYVFLLKEIFRTQTNALHIPNQCIKTFHMSYQQIIYALFLLLITLDYPYPPDATFQHCQKITKNINPALLYALNAQLKQPPATVLKQPLATVLKQPPATVLKQPQRNTFFYATTV